MGLTKVCHFSSVHRVWDTRVFYRECVSLAKHYDVCLIAIGKGTYVKEGVRVIGVPAPTNFLQRFLITIFRVFMLAVKEDAAIYHIHDAEMIPFGIALSILGKKVIYDIHENTADDILLKPWLKPVFRKLLASTYNALLKIGAHFMHYVVVIADPSFASRFFVKEKQFTIIQNFSDPNEFEKFRVENRSELPGNHLFYVGMIRDMYYKIDPLMEAIFLMKQKGTLLDLHLIGYYGVDTIQGFEHLPFWFEIKEQIHFYGFLEMEAAYEISQKCKIGICLKNQPNHMVLSHERKLFEYMGIGLPSVFCNADIYKAINLPEPIGIAVDLNSPIEILTAINLLLSKGELQNEMANSNLSLAQKKCNWNLEAEKLHKLYSHLLTATR